MTHDQLIDQERRRLQILVGTDRLTPDQARALFKQFKQQLQSKQPPLPLEPA